MHHLIVAVVTAAAFQAQSPPDSRPNLVVFVGDDLGWRDTRPYGNAAVRTPNIERLARSGRICLLTGQGATLAADLLSALVEATGGLVITTPSGRPLAGPGSDSPVAQIAAQSNVIAALVGGDEELATKFEAAITGLS